MPREVDAERVFVGGPQTPASPLTDHHMLYTRPAAGSTQDQVSKTRPLEALHIYY